MKLEGFTYFYPEKPKLLHNVHNAGMVDKMGREGWAGERKYNGSRLALHHINGGFQFWDRHGGLLKFEAGKELLSALSGLNLNGYWLFDGELRHNKTKGVSNKVMLFDVHIMAGELLTQKPFWWRRQILVDLGLKPEGEPVGIPAQFKGNLLAEFQRIIKESDEVEGLVLKDPKGLLRLGRSSNNESTWMFKLRRPSGRYHF